VSYHGNVYLSPWQIVNGSLEPPAWVDLPRSNSRKLRSFRQRSATIAFALGPEVRFTRGPIVRVHAGELNMSLIDRYLVGVKRHQTLGARRSQSFGMVRSKDAPGGN
jgi:hypothetical protein